MTIRVVFFLIMMAFILVLITGGIFAYKYWEGNRTSGAPLESSREIVTETMEESY